MGEDINNRPGFFAKIYLKQALTSQRIEIFR